MINNKKSTLRCLRVGTRIIPKYKNNLEELTCGEIFNIQERELINYSFIEIEICTMED